MWHFENITLTSWSKNWTRTRHGRQPLRGGGTMINHISKTGYFFWRACMCSCPEVIIKAIHKWRITCLHFLTLLYQTNKPEWISNSDYFYAGTLRLWSASTFRVQVTLSQLVVSWLAIILSSEGNEKGSLTFHQPAQPTLLPVVRRWRDVN